jgi:AraC-like DNA-binding protein
MDLPLLLMMIGVAQGIFLAALLFSSHAAATRADFWLGAFVLVFALATGSDILDRTAHLHGQAGLLHLFDWMLLLLGPLLYAYIRAMTGHPHFTWGSLALHAAPAGMVLLIFIPYHLLPADEKMRIVAADAEIQRTGDVSLLTIPMALQMGAYFLSSFLLLKRHARRLREYFSALESRNLRWLIVLVSANAGMYALWVGSLIFTARVERIANDVAFPVSVYLLGYVGLRHRGYIPPLVDSVPPTVIPAASGANSLVQPGDPGAKYSRSGLTQERALIVQTRLHDIMRSKRLFLDNDLSLHDLADALGVPSHQLSQLFNVEMKTTFYDYINELRVEEVKRLMADTAMSDESILGLAFEAGFNSKSAFNKAFRKQAGLTPREYRSRLAAGNSAR